MAEEDTRLPTDRATPAVVGEAATELSPDEQSLVDDIAEGIDRRLHSLDRGEPRAGRENVSFVVDCRQRVKERRWDRPRQRRVCAAIERRYLAVGWRYVSIYVMEHDHLRVRVTLRAQAVGGPFGGPQGREGRSGR